MFSIRSSLLIINSNFTNPLLIVKSSFTNPLYLLSSILCPALPPSIDEPTIYGSSKKSSLKSKEERDYLIDLGKRQIQKSRIVDSVTDKSKDSRLFGFCDRQKSLSGGITCCGDLLYKMDKSWIHILERTTNKAFKVGLEQFLEFAYKNKNTENRIKCPCNRCRNSVRHLKKVVYSHVMMKGFLETYKNWVHHGEDPWYLNQQNMKTTRHETTEGDDMLGLIHDALGNSNAQSEVHESLHNSGFIPEFNTTQFSDDPEVLDEDTKNFFKLLKHVESELYPGCKDFTLLSFIIRLLHVKSLCRWSNNSFTMLLEVLKVAFNNEMFPDSYREAWKIIKDLGLEYKKIHACPNDCMLYWKETENDDKCKHCKTPRYKQCDGQYDDSCKKERKVPAKLVRYFPLKPRLQRLFMSSKTASLMRWHAEERQEDGKLRHPADSDVWKHFDEKNPEFASDCRNVRLGLAADGFNPFKTMSIAHSTWPVVLVPYNLPPWKCMKQTSFLLCLLIDGPRAPGNDIDVYLQLLVDELKDLWDLGVPTFDAASKSMFQLHAALLWTINDFPAYANLSGWSTKGQYACPCCNKNSQSHWLKHGRKYCYTGHRRFIPMNHNFRNDRIHFDGSIEKAPKPMRLCGADILKQLEGMVNKFGKGRLIGMGSKRKREQEHENDLDIIFRYNWKKISVFFQLPYWKDNLIHHNLDIMHIEKNFLENLLWTLLAIIGKTKDNLKSRYDLQEMGIRKSLHPQTKGNKVYLPAASFTMSKQEKDIFCRVLKHVKVPDGYASNISKCVNVKERNVSGLKSHDCHILMQQLLPIALRRSVPKNVCKVIIDLCDIFRQLYSKVHSAVEFDALEDRIALTLCELEKIFPPSFFDVMEHLPVHLPEEARLAGPVQFRSMYPIERYLGTLKNYVRSRSHPEGSIAEGYLAEECMTFCSMYLDNVESKLTRPGRNFGGEEGSNQDSGRALGKEEVVYLDKVAWTQAHRYVLNNLDIVDSFCREHVNVLRREKPRMSSYEREKLHNESFYKWFKSYVSSMEQSNSCKDMHKDVPYLAAGPDKWVRRYSGYIINGLRFHTKQREMNRKTQNSGVCLNATTNSFSSRKDKNPITGDMAFYGTLVDIIELRYSNELKFVLFKCDWVDNNTGLKHDEFNFTLVNFNHMLYRHNKKTDEPFILASQAQQAWYVEDPLDPDWHVAVKMTPRDLFNVDPEVNVIEDSEDDQDTSQLRDNDFNEDDISWVRDEVEGVTMNTSASITNYDNDSSPNEDEYNTDGDSETSDDDDFFDEGIQPNEEDND